MRRAAGRDRMNAQTQKYRIDGPVGKIEIAIDRPDRGGAEGEPRGLALVAHPHPLFGGSLDNKVAQTLARTLVQLGYVAVRSNFRGVGATEGEHDDGRGEQDDLIVVIDHARTLPGLAGAPLVLAGFSFGTFVLSHVARRLRERGDAIERMVFVGTAASRWQVADVPLDTIVIHGELDDTVPIASVYDWARPQELPVVVIPGAEHFFHRKLHILKRVIAERWRV
jgi:alpha/beta superfamily hydrolase